MRRRWISGRILMLEPRRLAARAAANRMASLIGEPVGRTVGFRTRLESAVSSATRIEVVTTGLLVRRLLGDPGLDGVSTVILDEIHERSLEADLALALCLDAQAMLRPDLRLLAMSATLDGARLSAIMNAPIVESAGRMHPVEIRHAARDITNPRDLPEAMARAIRAALAEAPGDILAFLPGMGEIRRTEAALDGLDAAVLPLHGDLPPAAQDLALRPAEGRRVVLATAIAETSLTVPGRADRHRWRFSPRPALRSGERTDPAGDRACQPRGGRSARRPRGTRGARSCRPALDRARPSGACAPMTGRKFWKPNFPAWCWIARPGARRPASSLFRMRRPKAHWPLPAHLLTDLGAMDEAGTITPLGKRMSTLGAHPRLAAMMLAAEDSAQAARACDIAALLEGRDPLRAGLETPADIMARLEAIADPSAAAALGADRNAIQRHPPGGPAISRAARYRRRADGGGRSGAADRRGLSGPAGAAPRRARQFPSLGRRRRQACGDRSAGESRTSRGGGAGDENLAADPHGGAAGCRAICRPRSRRR